MKTLITGANGFIGSAVVRQLLRAGHTVRAMVRPHSDLRNLSALPVDLVIGDVRDRRSLDRAIMGCSGLFHIAADYRLWARRPQELYETNVTGTRNVMLAAGSAGVRRIVYTSSVATLRENRDGIPADETTPARLSDMIGHYKRSKFLAEAEVSRLAEEERLPVVIVNPSAPIGPRDIRPTPTGRIIVDALCGRMPAYVDTGLNLIHVDDVAIGHLLAFERGTIGERYILGGWNMTLKEILSTLAALAGRRSPRIRLPRPVLLPLAYLSETFCRLTGGREPRVTVTGVRLSRNKMFFSSEKAKAALGLNPRPVEEAFHDAINWFRQNGYVT